MLPFGQTIWGNTWELTQTNFKKCNIASTSEDFLKKHLETQIAWRYKWRKLTMFYFEALTLKVGCKASDDYDKSGHFFFMGLRIMKINWHCLCLFTTNDVVVGLCSNMMVMMKRAGVHFVKWSQTILHYYAQLCIMHYYYALCTIYNAFCTTLFAPAGQREKSGR